MNNNLYVLHLDTNFAALYFCYEMHGRKTEAAWILSRQQRPYRYRYAYLEFKLQYRGIYLKMYPVDQTNCPEVGDEKQSRAQDDLFHPISESSIENQSRDEEENQVPAVVPVDPTLEEKARESEQLLRATMQREKQYQECLKQFTFLDLDAMNFCQHHRKKPSRDDAEEKQVPENAAVDPIRLDKKTRDEVADLSADLQVENIEQRLNENMQKEKENQYQECLKQFNMDADMDAMIFCHHHNRN